MNIIISDKKNFYYYILILYTLLAFLFAYSIGTKYFSVDSWSYYELSQTIFSKNFYQFNTYRSYIDSTQSAAFPFGYPIVLAILNNLFPTTPLYSIFINIIFAIFTSLLVYSFLYRQLKISHIFSTSAAISLLFYPHFLDEIFSGRSIPLSLFLFVYGLTSFSTNKPIRASILLALSALVRFDFLIFSFISLNLFTLFQLLKSKNNFYLKIYFHYILVLAPWVIYSLIHFKSIWFSDNSWVAKSTSISSFVTDFPAYNASNIKTDTTLWIKKVLYNLKTLISPFFINLVQFPVFIGLSFLSLSFFKKIKRNNLKTYLVLIALPVFIAPYSLTGYIDIRYFTVHYLTISLALLFLLPNEEISYKKYLFSSVLIITISLYQGLNWFHRIKVLQPPNNKKHEELFLRLKKRQQNTKMTYLFENSRLASKYGALTNGKAALKPRNFSKMTSKQKSIFFKHISPYEIIKDPF